MLAYLLIQLGKRIAMSRQPSPMCHCGMYPITNKWGYTIKDNQDGTETNHTETGCDTYSTDPDLDDE